MYEKYKIEIEKEENTIKKTIVTAETNGLQKGREEKIERETWRLYTSIVQEQLTSQDG